MKEATYVPLSERAQMTRICLAFAGIYVNDVTAEIISRVFEMMEKKGGDFRMSDGADIEALVLSNFAQHQKKNIIQQPIRYKKILPQVSARKKRRKK